RSRACGPQDESSPGPGRGGRAGAATASVPGAGSLRLAVDTIAARPSLPGADRTVPPRLALAARAVAGAPPGDARLGDRHPAAQARLAGTAVHPELVLHRAALAVRRRVVAKRRPLPLD